MYFIECGGKLKSHSGQIYSPNYPNNFDAQDNCEWLIEVVEGHVIDFLVEDIDLVMQCNKVYLKVLI